MVDPATQAELNFKENEVVDVKHPQLCWSKGTVKTIEKQGSKNVVSVSAGDLTLKFNYPSPEFNNSLGKCGTKFKGNKCEKVQEPPNNPTKVMKKKELECSS